MGSATLSASEPTAATDTGDAKTAPLDILYLDRLRLISYASQLYDGEPFQRQMRDFQTLMREFVSGSADEEQSESTTAGGTAGLNAGVQFNAKALKVKADVLRKRGAHHATERTEGSEEHTTLNIKDNLLVAFLEDMRNRGWLRPFDPTAESPGLVKITGAMRFFDWTMIQEMLAGWHQLQNALKSLGGESKGSTASFSKETAKTMGQFTTMVGLGGFHLHMTVEGHGLIAPLASQHLTITREQTFVTYLRDEPIIGTLVALHNPSQTGEAPGIGLATSMQFGSLVDAFLGSSVRLLPLAVYFPLSDIEELIEPRPLRSTARLWAGAKRPEQKYRDRKLHMYPDGTRRVVCDGSALPQLQRPAARTAELLPRQGSDNREARAAACEAPCPARHLHHLHHAGARPAGPVRPEFGHAVAGPEPPKCGAPLLQPGGRGGPRSGHFRPRSQKQFGYFFGYSGQRGGRDFVRNRVLDVVAMERLELSTSRL